MTERITLTRAQRKSLLREMRLMSENRSEPASDFADEFADMMLRRSDLNLAAKDPMAVSDYAYGMAKWVDCQRYGSA